MSTLIDDILLAQDIFPLGEFEAIPVSYKGSGQANDYPDVVAIKQIPETSLLFQEAQENIKKIGNCYIKDRLPHIDQRISGEELREALEKMGFVKGLYQNFSLRRLGTNELLDFVQGATCDFFNSLGVDVFRQQYGLAEEGWKTSFHRDHENFKLHGFRGMLPLSASAYMAYRDEQGQQLIYRLEAGTLYFVNTAKFHRGFCFEKNRLNIMFQMASDELILASPYETKPLSDWTQVPESFREA